MAPHRDGDRDAFAQLDIDRGRNDRKLKSRFEHIFRKYEHDFTGVGDEFDIHTDEIVVNNGHLEHMRSEVDSGKSASSRFVKNFREKLAHEDESASDDEEDLKSEDSQDRTESEEDPEHNSVTDSVPGTGGSPHHGSSMRDDSTTAPAHLISRPPPRLPHLMQLLAGVGTPQRPSDATDDDSSETTSLYETASSVATPSLMFDEPRRSRRSPTAESRARGNRPMADDETVNALGMSIANQLAKLMGASSRKKKSKKKASTVRRAADPIWNYPELELSRNSKRKRDVSPPPQPPSPTAASPGTPSLWAIPDPEQGRKRRRTETPTTDNKETVRRFGSVKPSGEAKRCWNCSLTRGPSWHKGPHDQDLCQSCWRYYDYHGRMKGFDSVTPPAPELPDRPEIVHSPKPSSVFEQTPVSERGLMPDRSFVTKRMAIPEHTPVPDCTPVLERVPALEHTPALERTPVPESTPVLEPVDADAQANMPTVENHASMYAETQPGSRTQMPELPHGTILSEQSVSPPTTYAANTSRPIACSPPGPIYNKWSTEDDALLIRLKEHDHLSWEAIASHFPKRTLLNVQKIYSSRLKGKDGPGRELFNARLLAGDIIDTSLGESWTAQEDENLLAYREDDELEWEEIAARLPGRSLDAVQRRYQILVDGQNGIHDAVEGFDSAEQRSLRRVRRPYSAQENSLLIQLRELNNLKWHEIPRHFHGRTQASLQRHYSQLRPMSRKADAHDNGDITLMSITRKEAESQPTSLGRCSSSRRARRSLPGVMPSTTHRPGNALLRQAIGNSHRRRSYTIALPARAESQQLTPVDHAPFALDPASQALSNTARPGSCPDLAGYDPSAASLQLQQEMQQAHQSSPTVSAMARRKGAGARLEHVPVPSACTTPENNKVSTSLASFLGELTRSAAEHGHSSNQVCKDTPDRVEDVVSAGLPAHAPIQRADAVRLSPVTDATSELRTMSGKASADRTLNAASPESNKEGPGPRRGRGKRAGPDNTIDHGEDHQENNAGVTHDTSQPLRSEDSANCPRAPDVSWTNIVRMAFESTENPTMSNEDIFRWIESHHSYYSTASPVWKDRVREELRVNPRYEIDSARLRNTVWRMQVNRKSKGEELAIRSPVDKTSHGLATQNFEDRTKPTAEDGSEPIIDTHSQQTTRSSSRRVTFSPVVVVSTPVPTRRPRPRARLSNQGFQPIRDAEQLARFGEVLDSEPDHDVLPVALAPKGSSLPAMAVSPVSQLASELTSPRAPKSRTRKGVKKMGVAKAIDPAAAGSSSSPAFMKPSAHASINKTPKQPGWPRVARVNSSSARAARIKNTPIINHKFLTPNAHMTKRFVETPLRVLEDPEEDELA
ncbi:hypothetical protein CERZMDRAFT_92067 [Cercospora zeae-maydis SCOH1-5]|uniref:Myb-like domain-containing protein n=1 Tax=Cercospora zeae-maydis SCOH1-5 TaxID=717836 RepID=A0A6A6FV81_9PEZI|nr:hypothetical protein CERZMDRAFT_92067 [Cercospora zeae-maydis SCOH1-5]